MLQIANPQQARKSIVEPSIHMAHFSSLLICRLERGFSTVSDSVRRFVKSDPTGSPPPVLARIRVPFTVHQC